MKTLHLSIILILFVAGAGIVFAQSNDTQIQNGVRSTNSTCTDDMIQDMKTKYTSFDEERAKTEAVNYDAFKSEVKNDKYIFRAISQEWINNQAKCDVTFKNALVLFVVTDSSGKDRDVTVLINPESYKPQGIDVKYDVPIHGGVITTILSPFKQLESGISADQVKCNQGFKLIFKQEYMSPICVKPDTSKILIERGWATPIIGIAFQGQQTSSILKLSLATNSKTIHYGESIWMEISVSNTRPVPFMALSEDDWKFNASSLNVCSSSPVGISILSGYYTEENMTKGKQLSLYNNNVNCPYVLYEVTGYQFEPSSNKILSCSTNTNDPCTDHKMRYQVSFSGYWSDILHPFDIGTYTVIGADEWGHVAIEHFVVTNSESISITPENSQTLSINKNDGIVTGTRMIDISMNNFHQSRSPMVVQVYYPNDTLYRIDKIPSTSIQPDGFYKYNFTMSSSDANAVYGNHRIIVTYNNQTVETIAGMAVPP